jgi:hypothetical protein
VPMGMDPWIVVVVRACPTDNAENTRRPSTHADDLIPLRCLLLLLLDARGTRHGSKQARSASLKQRQLPLQKLTPQRAEVECP